MRCLNCRMVLMATEGVCPSCRTPTPNATRAATHGGGVPRRSGELEASIARIGSKLAGVPALKWAVGLSLFLVAGAVFLLALGCYFTYRSEEARGPREVTAAELIDLPNRGPVTDPWLSYAFPASCDTAVRLQKRSVGTQRAYSRFILVQVRDRWLAAQVPPGFRGNKLVGKVERLGTWDGATFEKNLDAKIIAQLKATLRGKADRLLPYQVNAVLPYQSKIRGGYMTAGLIALGGLLVGGLGVTLIRAKPQPR